MITNSLRKKPKFKPVTLIVGILCKDGIAMAGDSQTTYGGTSKTWDTKKMTDIEHGDGHVLIAESGAEITSSAIVEELRGMITKKVFLDAGEMPQIAEAAVRKVRARLRSQHFDCSSEELQSIIERNALESEVLIAHYLREEPIISTIGLSTGIAKQTRKRFVTIGCGSELANYLLNESCPESLDLPIAVVTAVHVIETVKRYDPYCGGPTRLGVLLPGHRTKNFFKSDFITLQHSGNAGVIVNQSFTQEIVDVVLAFESSLKEKRIELMRLWTQDMTNEVQESLKRLVDEKVKNGEFVRINGSQDGL